MATIYSSWERNSPNRELGSRTSSYRFTITDLNDPMLHDLKGMIRVNNKKSREYHRKLNSKMDNKWHSPLETVRLRARGPRHKCKAWEQSLPVFLETNRAWDVYVHEDTTGIQVFNKEIETGQSASVQQKIAKMEYEILKLKSEADESRKDWWKITFMDSDRVITIAETDAAKAKALAKQCYGYIGTIDQVINLGKNPVIR